MKISDCNISKFQYFKGTLIYIRCPRYVIIGYNIFVWLNDRDVTKAMSTRIWTGLKTHFFSDACGRNFKNLWREVLRSCGFGERIHWFVWTKIIIIKNPGSYRWGKGMDVRCNYIENQK